MSLWTDTALSCIYTLTPTHCGTGQTSGAVDLPIARDAASGFPVLPATAVKGVIRDYLGRGGQLDKTVIESLFGKTLENAGDTDSSTDAPQASAGLLSFTEARLAAYPVRSLNQPFFHVTCPLILERLDRDLRALGLAGLDGDWGAEQNQGKVIISDERLAGRALVLEDVVFAGEEVAYAEAFRQVGERLAGLLPDEEKATRLRVENGLVLIPDSEFADLMASVIPVRARIKLTDGKTTDAWIDPATGEKQSGNLWYEEELPADCLLLGFVGQRRAPANGASLNTLIEKAGNLHVVQIGGNETVGQGLCFWALHRGKGETA